MFIKGEFFFFFYYIVLEIAQIQLTLCYNVHMKYKNYIWDLGGTLLNNYESSSHAFAAALWQSADRIVLHEDIYNALKVSTDYAVNTFARDIPDFLTTYKKLEAETLKRPILFPGASKVLSVLMENGRQNFMISHRDSQVMAILKKAHIDQFFIEVVTADNGFSRKPAPDSIYYLLKKYKLNPDETVMIGDRPIDIEAGLAAGVQTVFFDTKKTDPRASQNIQNLTELLGL